MIYLTRLRNREFSRIAWVTLFVICLEVSYDVLIRKIQLHLRATITQNEITTAIISLDVHDTAKQVNEVLCGTTS